jgi:4-hydroxy 2-oxovalerate aldolase
MKILDCTLRDGGYYTNWDFDRKLVDTYMHACNELPIDYIEVGYRSTPLQGYFGEYFYLPLYVMERLKGQTTKKLAIILNEKDIRPKHIPSLLAPCKGLMDMVRLAIDPKQFGRALKLAVAVKAMGFKVGFNVMYMSKWKGQKDFLQLLPEVKGIADYFYMVDSYGGVYPNDVRETIQLVKSFVNDVPLGFHGHNNLELALINTLTAIEEGCDIVDATVTGMGRGAGNLSTELLLTVLQAKGLIDVDFNKLSNVVDVFNELKESYRWGTNLPYMVSGANSLPQKNVMAWMSKKHYSVNAIIRALTNESKGVEDNNKLPVLNHKGSQEANQAMLVGGGKSVPENADAIRFFLKEHPEIPVIHASPKNASHFKQIENPQYFCLIGNEGYRLEKVFKSKEDVQGVGVLPPYPRKMGTYVPQMMEGKAYELPHSPIFNKQIVSHTSIALHLAEYLGVEELLTVGYDGYSNQDMDSSEQELFMENTDLFSAFCQNSGATLISLTPTKYKGLTQASIFSKI